MLQVILSLYLVHSTCFFAAHVYTYICIYTYVLFYFFYLYLKYIYMYIYIHIHIYAHIFVRYPCIIAWCTHIYIIFRYMYMYMYKYRNVCMNIYIYIYIYKYMHACPPANWHSSSLNMSYSILSGSKSSNSGRVSSLRRITFGKRSPRWFTWERRAFGTQNDHGIRAKRLGC